MGRNVEGLLVLLMLMCAMFIVDGTLFWLFPTPAYVEMPFSVGMSFAVWAAYLSPRER